MAANVAVARMEDTQHAGAAHPAYAMRQQVLVSNLQLAADIGVYAHEIGRRQSLVVHVVLDIEPAADDLLSGTIDYNVIVDAARALADERIALIETFGQRLAAVCMAHPSVERAEVLVEKPGALHHALAASRTVLERSRPQQPALVTTP
jgi:7,8-dihydroneopterin aldolase/epimerase/oxygenase